MTPAPRAGLFPGPLLRGPRTASGETSEGCPRVGEYSVDSGLWGHWYPVGAPAGPCAHEASLFPSPLNSRPVRVSLGPTTSGTVASGWEAPDGGTAPSPNSLGRARTAPAGAGPGPSGRGGGPAPAPSAADWEPSRTSVHRDPWAAPLQPLPGPSTLELGRRQRRRPAPRSHPAPPAGSPRYLPAAQGRVGRRLHAGPVPAPRWRPGAPRRGGRPAHWHSHALAHTHAPPPATT